MNIIVFIALISWIGLPVRAGGKAGTGERATDGKGEYVSLFVEPYQAAFYMLIPKGWKTEGGMIPSGLPWNKADLIGSNIRFRATSPDGKAFFGWYPKFFFSDPRLVSQSSMGILNPPVGGVHNGFWMYPYMTIPQFAQTVVFGQLASKEFVNPRLLGGVKPSPELQPLVPQVATHSQCGWIDYECSVTGIPMRGRLYAVLYDMGGQGWMNAATFGWIAAKDRWQESGKLMERCIRTFKLNPDWAAKAAAAEMRRGNQMAALERQLAEEDLKMQREHLAHSSDSQTEFYKVLTGQMEARAPKSGEEKWMPAYNRAFADGNGNYFLTDDTGPLPIESNPAWHAMGVINRNAR